MDELISHLRVRSPNVEFLVDGEYLKVYRNGTLSYWIFIRDG